jgi:WD40 repeat protein
MEARCWFFLSPGTSLHFSLSRSIHSLNIIWDLRFLFQGDAVSFDGLDKLEAGCFDPHHVQQFASVNDKSLRTWDFRTSKYVSLLMCHVESW